LYNVGSEYQRHRRSRNLPQTYSFDKSDLSNIPDYNDFVAALVKAYNDVAKYLRPGAHLTVVVKNVKRPYSIYVGLGAGPKALPDEFTV
jgi:archaellum component FlaF (FlaF/FlaG flagellin family)